MEPTSTSTSDPNTEQGVAWPVEKLMLLGAAALAAGLFAIYLAATIVGG